ncbi:MAG: MATE family efflux transporter [Erysipelotrichaceae bacterium]|nr:MATE family efflux transporter [Erysipelotrichaceae bacterium]
MRKNETPLDIANGPLLKNIFIFSVPLIFTQMLQMFFNSADTIIVGKFAGDTALAAVGATGSIVFLLTSVFFGLSTGANVLIARYIGRGDQHKIKDAVHSSMMIAIWGGIVLTFVGIFFAKPLLALMGTPDEIIDLSTLYMRIYFAGVIALLLYNFGSAVLRSKGDTKRPLYFLILSGIVNVLLNLFTVIVLKWSVAGVAFATVASQVISAALVLYVLVNEEDATRLDLLHLYAEKNSVIEIMRIGIPAGLSAAVFALSNVVVQSSINSFNSTAVVAGNSAGSSIENFVYIGYTAFNQATITFTSQCLGAGRTDRIKEILIKTGLLVAVSAVLMSSVVYYTGPLLLQLYTNEQAVIDVGMIRTALVARFLVLNGLLDVFVNSLRGMGYSTLPTVLMIAGICGIRIGWIYTVFPTAGTLESIYMCFPVSWLCTTIVEAILWFIVYRKVVNQ